jgi:hypothetical protein
MDAVKEIMAKVISAGSAAKYAGQNAIFAMFCLDSAKLRASLLEQWFMDNISTYLKLHKKQKYGKECCLKINPDDDNCPFKLSILTLSHFSDFITQRKARKEKIALRRCPLAMHPTSSHRVLSSICSA